MSNLSDETTDRLGVQIKRYGIESPELLAELTDHYAHQMEERIKEGMSEEEAFARFKSENSWLKLRKLQYKHWEQGADAMHRLLKAQLLQIFAGPLGVITYPLIISLWWLFGRDLSAEKGLLIAVHFSLAAIVTALIIGFVVNRQQKHRFYASVLQLSLFELYLLIYIPLMFPGFFDVATLGFEHAGKRLAFTAFYVIVFILTYIVVKLYTGARERSVKLR